MPVRPCWCGHGVLTVFNAEYAHCPHCETLVLQVRTPAAAGRVGDDARDFYGHDYWFVHQAELGFTNIEERARTDLPNRCVHWLRVLLRYRQPPLSTLELGCAHSGFVAMLRATALDATGLEMSPSIAG